MGNKLKRWLTGLLLGVVALSAVAEGPAAWTYSAKPWSQWVLGAQLKPTFNLNLAAIAAGNYDPLTITRATSGTMFDSAGTLVTKSTDVARVDYDPATLALRGLLIEEARTNSLRNNTMVGASAGTPGTAPTNWIMAAAAGNLTALNVVGTGTENGISYVDLRWITSGAINDVLVFEQTTQIVASDTQTWTGSQYCKLVGGSLTNVALGNRVQFRTAAGANVSTSDQAFTPTSSGLATQRNITTFTASGGTIARVTNGILLTFSGAADVTLRIGMPQLELGAFATSVISTSTVAVTRAADLASITGANFTSFWNATQGTIVAQYLFNRIIGSGEFPVVAAANDGTTGNVIESYAFLAAGSNRSSFTGNVAGVSQFDLGSGSATFNGAAGTAHKLASAYAANNFAAAFDGSAVLADTSGSLPTVNRMTLGAQGNGTQYLNGWISSLSYYPIAVDAVTLTQIASGTVPVFAANDDVFWLTASAR